MLKSFSVALILLLTAVVSSGQKPAQDASAPSRKKSDQTTIQNRIDLEKERAALQKEIGNVKRSLDETHQHQRESLAQLANLQRKLSLRQAAILNTNAQVKFIHRDMNESGQESINLQRDLDTLRARYAANIVSAYKSRSSYDYLSFIFSATSFNDALIRIQYFRSYQAYRKEEADNMLYADGLLRGKINALNTARLEKGEMLKKQHNDLIIIEKEKNKETVVVKNLTSKEKELEQQMATRQRQDRKLASAIATAIKHAKTVSGNLASRDAVLVPKAVPGGGVPVINTAPQERKRETRNSIAADPVSKEGTKETKSTPVYKGLPTVSNEPDIRMSESFEKHRGHLRWPVGSASVAMHFGLHVYPNGLKGFNQGLTITISAGSPVTAVFDGEVQAVFPVEDVEAVIIRHGKYFTVYSNLSTVSVVKGEQVKSGQVLGHVADIGQLEFLLSDEKDHMFDPEKWLKQ